MQHVVSQLIGKKEQLIGELNFHKSKIVQLEEVLKGIDISIRVFEPDFNLSTVKPKRYTGVVHYFKKGESFTMILDTLRKAQKPISSLNITIEIMKIKKLNYDNVDLLNKIQRALLVTMKNLEKQNLIKSVGKDWCI